MAFTTQQLAELQRIESEIARCELILGVTDGLGASHSDLGQSATYTTQQIDRAERKLPMLQSRKTQIEASSAGTTTPNPYVNKGILA